MWNAWLATRSHRRRELEEDLTLWSACAQPCFWPPLRSASPPLSASRVADVIGGLDLSTRGTGTASSRRARSRQLRMAGAGRQELHPPTRAPRATDTRAKRIFDMYGCVVVRGLNRQYVEEIRAHADATFEQARNMEAGELSEVVNGDQRVGWVTPDQTLWILRPGHARECWHGARPRLPDVRAMFAPTARRSTSSRRCSTRRPASSLLQGPGHRRVWRTPDAGGVGHRARSRRLRARRQSEAHAPGLCLLHVRRSWLRRRSTTPARPIHARQWPTLRHPRVAPLGHIAPSHLGLPPDWSFDDGLCVEGEAGDAILFQSIHGSPPNRSTEARATFINRYWAATTPGVLRHRRRDEERRESRLRRRGPLPSAYKCARPPCGRRRPRRGR